MSIFTRSLPTIKQLQKSIALELLHYENATAKSLAKAELEKTKTYYDYLKRVKETQGGAKDTKGIDAKLADLTKKGSHDNAELQDKTSFNGIVENAANDKLPEEYTRNNLENVHQYLKNQREYFDLLTRYNPGLLMSQSDNVSKTANRVGLEVPN
ncbi:ATP synthase assembly factor FMC1, mitochondrial [Candida viswanathii]|uniref:ATP synthase assembly factor FMC1, mitochondrial n=1 Tax=Candida viswanathii TaxID=5486 RepID=A0A367YBJ8_9ASCO|nr:ATP synthase assembly factor FMC1, mitochondrial [Candida viswanathii]RCK63127.1 ATP synthase assembly factor FMC1, mitochondrial [Candida viswanathii]